jgi:flavin reductase (DIM6/NTAB) family NADH-FMN oxidoreductase RutF
MLELAATRLERAAAPNGVGAEAFRDAFSRVPAAVSVVTTMNDEGRPHATTVSAFCSLSADPPLILVALAQSSDLLRCLRSNERFGVNVLAVGQETIGRGCAQKGFDKLADIPWYEADGLPRLEGGAAWLACDLHDLLPGGDHEIVIGLVTACSAAEREPLLYHRRRFVELAGQASPA